MSAPALRAAVEAVYRAAVERVDGGVAVRRTLALSADGGLLIGDRRFDPGEAGVFAIAIGKAGCQMMAAVEAVAGDRFAGGLVVTKSVPAGVRLRSRIVTGSHPVPDERSLEAGRALVEFVAGIPHGAVVLCLISGGGSALVESLQPDTTLDQLRHVTATLLRDGASIDELNAVRSRLSRLKGGGLLDLLAGRTVVNLIISDVLGNPLRVIASGPTVEPTADERAEVVAHRFAIDITLPPRSERALAPPAATVIVADIAAAIGAAADAARAMGLAVHVIGTSIDTEAWQAGRLFASMVADTAAGRTTPRAPCCILAGGETVVTVRGDGVGGRNCEAAVAAAIRLAGIAGCAVGCLATDGDDGTSGAAGGIVDGDTLDDLGSARAALEGNDAYTWLARRGAALVTGPSGTNVNDLFIGVVAPDGWTGR